MTTTYHMSLDGGEGGTDTTTADNIREAMASAMAWAADGDWSNA